MFSKEILMRKEGILLAIVMFLCLAGVAWSQEGKLHGAVGVTYDTKYVWRGITVYGQKSAIHPFVDIDLMGTGFGLNVTGHRANASGYEISERWDYTLYYKGACCNEEKYAARYMLGYRYFNYPDMSSHKEFTSPSEPGSVDLQEVFAAFSFPSVIGVKGLVPSYVIVKGWPSNSNTLVGAANPNGGTYSGVAHIFMLDYALQLSELTTAVPPEQVLNLHIETVYNDGVDPRPMGAYTDGDWTHVLMGVTTDFNLGGGLILTPGIYYQITMEDDGTELIPGVPTSTRGVSPDHDIAWFSMTAKYTF